MSEGNGFQVLTHANRVEILEQKILQYEASLWDATLELNVALAAEDESSIGTQTKRRSDLEKAVQALRAQRQALGSPAPEPELVSVDSA